jgi:type VI secretion system protein ImpJ
MSWNNKVIWSEGMFLKPHHFQQHTRYLENYVEGRSAVLRSYPWGFKRLQIDRQLLTLGKLGISSAQGVFPDGTPFKTPDDEDPPSSLDIRENTQNTVVYLGLPVGRPGAVEADINDDPHGLARYLPRECGTRDSNAGSESEAQLQVGKLRMRLLLDNEKLDDYLCIGMARIVECRSDNHVVLDEEYIPTVLNCQAEPVLTDFMKELQGKLHSRGDALAGRVTTSGRGAAEIATFLFLQLVNRYEPLVAHLATLEGLHPESLYRLALEIAGELATFASDSKRPIGFPAYRHDDLQTSFAPLIAELRRYLSMEVIDVAVPIVLKKRKWGFYKAAIEDNKLLTQASFVLAVTANIPAEDLRGHFPNQVQIGAVEKIEQQARGQLPGIRLRPLAVAPRQIPFHTGVVYFELDTGCEEWQELQVSGAIAMHVSAEISGLDMELWAIRAQ